jgi:predicted DNA-binding transcriptional regulator AlpA
MRNRPHKHLEELMQNKLVRIADIATTPKKAGMLPVSPATIWRWVRDDKFPKPFKIGSITAWYANEIDDFVAQCSGRTVQ